MWHSGPIEHLSREARIALDVGVTFTCSSYDAMQSESGKSERGSERRENGKSDLAARCAFCLGPLENGEIVCSAECDEGYWELVPTRNGKLWDPSAPRKPKQPTRKNGRPSKFG